MDPREATSILNIAGGVGNTLHQDFNDFQHKLLQTEQDIERLKGVSRRLKEIRNGAGFEDEDPDVDELILTIGNALVPLGKTIARLDTKRECLNLCINAINSAVRFGNKFANKIPAIPKLN